MRGDECSDAAFCPKELSYLFGEQRAYEGYVRQRVRDIFGLELREPMADLLKLPGQL